MKIIPLNCPSCGARLEIGENKEQVACGTCGSQLFVDRSGGTISLELAKSLGAISAGATQTAAELALVRLEKERSSAHYEVIRLEREIEDGTSALAIYTFKAQDIMSEKAVASTDGRVKTLEAEKKSLWFGYLSTIIAVILIIICISKAYSLALGITSEISIWEKLFLMLIPVGFVGFILWLVIIGILALIDNSIETQRKNQQSKNLSDLREQLLLHQKAVEFRKKYEEAKVIISQANEILPNARVSLARIEEEISHNKKIVSLKH